MLRLFSDGRFHISVARQSGYWEDLDWSCCLWLHSVEGNKIIPDEGVHTMINNKDIHITMLSDIQTLDIF